MEQQEQYQSGNLQIDIEVLMEELSQLHLRFIAARTEIKRLQSRIADLEKEKEK
jgi:hypothetical protein